MPSPRGLSPERNPRNHRPNVGTRSSRSPGVMSEGGHTTPRHTSPLPTRRAKSPRLSTASTSPGRRLAGLPQGPALQQSGWTDDAEANRSRHIERRAAARTKRQEQDTRCSHGRGLGRGRDELAG